ncbi:MAG: 2-polyprenyl-6-hydroxyphenyl methylase/3-demethylubiquinone-9 3-methyltransferase [Cycloclasticus pugetii]|jgi:2-polyprenyl-6-hydroxyphenyl methylase/3-demethylubiquinone-9 3-methyltransferase|uniref:Ubiquinone biosynthesis O-methyltransferase n=2 Tax=Cycloclasticus TaxID=34067 RepID=S5T6U2_9GAMM|nr:MULTISPECIES: bifunctional 2-polyprenyl-6-hydroxyphenol methylase/3-demethylubiquinol 3-O-methyltransferase UbiG [Cycloclasticus]AFT67293.1 Bifunctional 3-demethylubiquinone-9 3-methyltransferase and 2-octaprenyl-6-hydroxy phenol methylase [Cycloclasticus sp. P1]AGS39501.1 2-polyprenyl-6-hydroxyphenyl methylase / 3-demethylubiquinone-9 3-methyltransferase [Cycloclasticus zancles 78-ME]ATI03099.1 bifunctional 2-polyprenyl-6-hydroxyphenol methylase/3-demethylubiquinol 3-O-methyltransferase UbiG|tara:strand:+ start:1434 stop:2144 length:711 start_codon:yes stop_codon:yes gene_type:complete
MTQTKDNVNPSEIEKFSAMASQWWDTEGNFKTLHQINPLRLNLVDKTVSLSGKDVLDVGCGGGILSESMALKGANVTGIDLGKELLDVADLHSLDSGVSVNYQHISVEALASQKPEQFDCVTCMEMLEHVPDPVAIINACSTLVKPGGYVFLSTLNRNPKAYLLSIIGAEYILGMMPKGTHDYASFIKPSELALWARQAGLTLEDSRGIEYNPFNKSFSMSDDISVNYICVFKKTV